MVLDLGSMTAMRRSPGFKLAFAHKLFQLRLDDEQSRQSKLLFLSAINSILRLTPSNLLRASQACSGTIPI